MVMAAPPAHVSVHVAPPLQLSEHWLVHAMSHFAPPPQLTLALEPTVMSHVDDPVH